MYAVMEAEWLAGEEERALEQEMVLDAEACEASTIYYFPEESSPILGTGGCLVLVKFTFVLARKAAREAALFSLD